MTRVCLARALVATAAACLPITAGARAAAPPQASDTAVVRGYDVTRAYRLFGELMSPFCPGLTLATCPSEGADSLRQDIRDRLARGETSGDIRAAYAAAWGTRILGTPPLRSGGFLLWLAPIVMLGLGAAGLFVWLKSHRPVGGGAPPEAPEPLDEHLKERLAAELKALDDRS